MKWLYGTVSILRSTENEFIWGGNGLFQGDALGGRVHDTALQRSLVEAAEATVKELGNQLEVVAFRDDVYVIADPVTAVKANSLIDERRGWLRASIRPRRFAQGSPSSARRTTVKR